MDKILEEFLQKPHFTIKVKSNSPKTKITGFEDDTLKLDVKAPPENNKANIEIIKFFKRLTKKDAKITKGLTSKIKVVRLI